MSTLTLAKVYEDLQIPLALELLDTDVDLNVQVTARDVHRPGMALMGFTANFLPGRLQVMGESEMAYLASLSPAEQATAFARVLELDAPACFISQSLDAPATILNFVNEHRVPLFRSSLPAVDFITELSHYLEHQFAPRTDLHGTLVDVYGVGMLFTGRSGIGKSECALDLVERGHRLVADDIVEVTKTGEDIIVGSHRKILRHNIEIRGVGVIDVQSIYGVRAIRMQKRIELEVRLQDWDDREDYERLGLEQQTTAILGVSIPSVVVPLFPGKNITVISEVIALDFMLKFYGYDAAQVLNQRILESMGQSEQIRYFQRDKE
ncbi:MAG: HPr(Ser) kinase/phosphatase [bacterium]